MQNNSRGIVTLSIALIIGGVLAVGAGGYMGYQMLQQDTTVNMATSSEFYAEFASSSAATSSNSNTEIENETTQDDPEETTVTERVVENTQNSVNTNEVTENLSSNENEVVQNLPEEEVAVTEDESNEENTENPDGPLSELPGDADQIIVEVTHDFSYYPTGDRSDEVSTVEDDGSEYRVLRTEIEVMFDQRAPVGQVNDFLDKYNAEIVDMIEGMNSLILQIQDPGDIESLNAIISQMQSEEIVMVVIKSILLEDPMM